MLRRKLSTLVVAMMLMAIVSTFFGCDLGKPKAEDGMKSVVIIIGSEQISYSTDSGYVHELLKEMNDKQLIEYEYSDGAYGATVNRLNNLITDIDWDPFISVYHNIDDVTLRADFGEYAMLKYEFNGANYYPSSVGVDSLPVKNGGVYVFIESALN